MMENQSCFTAAGEKNSPQSHISHDATGYWELFESLWKIHCTSLDMEQRYKEQARAYQAEIKEMRGVIIKLVDELITLR